jgi:hypothetical protein
MPEIGTFGLMSGGGKRSVGNGKSDSVGPLHKRQRMIGVNGGVS